MEGYIMAMPSALLKVMSILLIIFASIILFAGILSAIGSGLSFVLGKDGLAGAAAIILLVLAICAVVSGLLLMLCGVFGVKAKYLKACFIMALALLAIEIIIFVILIVSDSIFTEGVLNPLGLSSIIGIVLLILYTIGVKQTKTRAAAIPQPPPTVWKPE